MNIVVMLAASLIVVVSIACGPDYGAPPIFGGGSLELTPSSVAGATPWLGRLRDATALPHALERSLVALSSYRVSVMQVDHGYREGRGPWTKTRVTVYEYETPGRYRRAETFFEYLIDNDGDGALNSLGWSNVCGGTEQIIVGVNDYLGCGTDPWHLRDRQRPYEVTFNNGSDLFVEYINLGSLSELGRETIDKRQMRVFLGSPLEAPSDVESMATVWIDEETSLLRRVAERHEFPGHAEERPSFMVVTLDFGGFNTTEVYEPITDPAALRILEQADANP